MSLKTFHVFFITLAILMILGCGAGAVRVYLASGGALTLAMGIVAFVCAGALVIYEVWFVRKKAPRIP